jgi:pyridoxamine 5'-phosphate oxidase
MSLSDLRTDYRLDQLNEDSLLADPLRQFSEWLQQAIDYPIAEPTAMCLSTVNELGRPSSRIVLLKNVDQGLWFFTHYRSRKGQEIALNPFACLNFFWQPLERQVRIEGKLHQLTEHQSQEYFNSRPLGSRLGAMASPQSQPIEGRWVLESALADLEQRYQHEVPSKPQDWGGYCLVPTSWEFWQGRTNRLHDRIVYFQDNQQWVKQRLAP